MRGVAAGELDDALFRVRTRDLLPLGPDDIDNSAQRHPELLGRHADILLRHWALQQSDPHQQQQMEIRRDLLRRLAAPRRQALYEQATQAEAEHRRTGERAPLEHALEIRRGMLTDDSPFVSEELFQATRQGLSRLLQQRFTVTGSLGDLDEAVDVAQGGVDAVPPETAELRVALLTELGNSLNMRFRDLGAREDIDRVIGAFTEVDRLPRPATGDPDDTVTNTVNLSTAYLDRGFRFSDPDDFDLALELAREALAATPPSSHRRWTRLNNLASALRAVAKQRADRALLSEALELHREAIAAPDPTQRAHIAAGLAQTLEDAAEAGLSTDDPDEAYRVACRKGLDVNLSAAVWAGMSWGRGGWKSRRWEAAAEAYGYVAQAVRQHLRHQREESQQEIRLSQFREVGARAAYALARVGRKDEAVLAFELSRAQLLAEAMSESGVGSPPQTSAPPAGEVVLTVDEIRAAAGGRDLAYLVPTELGGVALLVRQQGGTTVIELPALTEEAVGQRLHEQLEVAAASQTARAWLWRSVMAPVLDELGASPGLVIVAGGLLGMLPLHVASTSDPSRPTGQRSRSTFSR
jgi:tetratricopeptide (TPR) repeat protein